MEFMSRGGRPASHPGAAQNGEAGPTSKRGRGESKNMRYLFTALLFGVALLLIFVTIYIATGNSNVNGEAKYVDTGKYQAVFLNNNQVYFGKIQSLNDKYTVISDVFYLQVNQSVQPSSTTQQNANNNNNLVLQKLGKTELHGPEDTMIINSDEVTFWENIKDSSQVVSAINKYKANPNAANQGTTTP